MASAMASPLGGGGGFLNTRLSKKVIITTAAVFFSLILLGGLYHYQPQQRAYSTLPSESKPSGDVPGGSISPALEPSGQCQHGNGPTLEELDKKYAHLSDTKFTIAMQTYRRPKELKETLEDLTKDEIPSLEEIVIVWNDIEDTPPEDYVSKHGVSVRYRVSTVNSLNQKLIPDTDYKTKAILLTDDDVYYKPSDLEFVFQTWRKFGQFRLVGALPRCAKSKNGKYHYDFCTDRKDDDGYSMILTNLCFSHIAFMDYYSSEADDATKIREYVDEHFNCEDIALNYMASKLTGFGPLEVNGHDRYKNMNPSAGISTKPGHLEARSQCLNDFEKIFGCMPLVEETARIQRGVHVL